MTAINFATTPFDEAIRYFQRKVNLPTRRWTDLWQGMHTRAFVVAGAMKEDLLSDLRGAVDKAIAEGTTLAEFRRDFDDIVARHGWSYRGKRGWRTGVIYNTNLRTAHAAGRYQQMADPDVLTARPYWRYIGGLSGHPREEHLSWSGTVLKHDDPWWQTHYPPNGWGCKCKVVSHSAREIERMKAAGTRIKTTAPADAAYSWRNPRTGATVQVPRGIDPGWAYNPGEAAWGRNQALRLMEDQGPWRDVEPWGPDKYKRPPAGIPIDATKATPGKTVKRGDEEGLRNALRAAIGGEEVGFRDPAGETTMVTQAICDHILEDETRWDGREAYFPFIPELMEDPYEIWVSFARSELSGRVAIRKKYVKAIRLDRNRILGLYAETRDGLWESGNFFRGGLTGAGNLRKGRLLYGRK